MQSNIFRNTAVETTDLMLWYILALTLSLPCHYKGYAGHNSISRKKLWMCMSVWKVLQS